MGRLGPLGSAAFRAFWGARAVSLFGDRIAAVALVLAVYQREGSGVAVGLLLLAEVAPQFFGPLAGAVADRADHRRLMIGCDLGRCLIFGAIALAFPPFPALLALILAAGILSTLFSPAGRSTVPALVGPAELASANALLGSALNVSIAVGPAIGGIAVAAFGARVALALDALSFLLSALLVTRLPRGVRATGGGSAERRLLGEARAGLAYLVRHPTARAVALGLFLVVVFGGVDNVALVFLARDTLRTGDAGYGLLAAAYGVGMVLAPLAVFHPRLRAAPAALKLAGVGLFGAGTALTGLAPTVGVALACQALGGVGNGLENVADDTLIGQTVPAEMLGRVFGITYSGVAIASGLAYAVGGPLLALLSPRAIFVAAGVGVLVSLAVIWVLLPRSAAPVGGAGRPQPGRT